MKKIDLKKIAIIGVGNYLMSDEGVGVHAIKYLEQFKWPEGVELIDMGVPGASLIYELEKWPTSVIIDCADFKAKPGEIIFINSKKLAKENEEMISLHNASLMGTIALAEKLNIKIGEVYLLGIQPQSLSYGMTLSKPVEQSLSEIKSTICTFLNKLSPENSCL